jgi:hypothetical protein
MLKTIAEVSPHLTAFVLASRLSLSRPQLQHATQMADALITTEGSKTLSGLYRHIVGDLLLLHTALLPGESTNLVWRI